MVAYVVPGPCCYYAESLLAEIDDDEFDGSVSLTSESEDPQKAKNGYSYSISGTTGALGGMLFTEASQISGTWYDRTDSTNELIDAEAELGLSKFASKEFQQSANTMKRNLKSPSAVDVNIRFETVGRIESITVIGESGIRSFVFDFDQVAADAKKQQEKRAKRLARKQSKTSSRRAPKRKSNDDETLKPFMDTIKQILDAVVALR